MNKREEALVDALRTNAEETERWRLYLKENETAKENLEAFQKKLTVDVMVPLGKRALMPGHLVHTNEVMVGHYQGYFSKCSTFKASQICDLRIKTAQERLEKLDNESQLWQNKLEKPYVEGVVPSGEERDIIEEYNEEQESLWRQKHRQSVKQAKLKERQQREKEQQMKKIDLPGSVEKSEEEIFKMLEDAEIMEELEQELDKLEIDEINDETIKQLMSGDMKLPPSKPRIAHDATKCGNKKTENENQQTAMGNNIVKKQSLHSDVPSTNNNVVPNPEMSGEDLEDEQSQNADDEDALPIEVKIIKEQAEFLTNEDQIGFYEYHMEIIRQKVASLPQQSQEQINEKIRLFSVLENLEELLEEVETAVGNDELAAYDNLDEIKETEEENTQDIDVPEEAAMNNKKHNQKRRISFAAEDQTLEFCKNEAVSQMMINQSDKPPAPKRDIITLDDNRLQANSDIIPTNSSMDKKSLINAKVEQHRQFISETQCEQDFDVIQKIINGYVNTLKIPFKHSSNTPPEVAKNIESQDNNTVPGTPGEIYDMHMKALASSKGEEQTALYINSYEGEEQVKAPVLKESDRLQAFEDPKAQFSNPKSILRNNAAINEENIITQGKKEKKSKKKKRTAKEEAECISAYQKVMNDVVEKPLSEPEPLPEGTYIDAHAPKRRVSRFKQMRQGLEQT